ncbi:MAG: hypothetical protein A3J25_01665 [Pseudomonadales bacterium RIFCSPLOWO2_02_FULL_63_210]|nr:MAG: hypothetical protein A3J25_01665 [Pseudomonadales bacterium RIFCSPLOWO2_02_FULL_63_210]
MRLHLLLIPALLLLGACQTTQLNRDFDPDRDFAAYRSWNWLDGQQPAGSAWASSALVQEALSNALDQRQDQVTTHYGGFWGGSWNGYWGGPGYSETRTLDYQTGTLQIDLYDSQDGKLVWRGSGQQIVRDSQANPSERSAKIRETVAKVLSQYPPH